MTRACAIDVVMGQALSDSVAEGGGTLKMRYGQARTRFAAGLDTTRSGKSSLPSPTISREVAPHVVRYRIMDESTPAR